MEKRRKEYPPRQAQARVEGLSTETMAGLDPSRLIWYIFNY